MNCRCGQEVKLKEQTITLPRSVAVWGLHGSQAPVKLETFQCPSCQRFGTRIYSLKTGELLKEDL